MRQLWGAWTDAARPPVALFAKQKWNVSYVDTITDAGIVNLIAYSNDPQYLQDIQKKIIEVSVRRHKSKGVVVWAHQDCAGNPVSDEEQKQDTLRAVGKIKTMLSGLEIVPVFVVRGEPDWRVVPL